MTTVSGSMDGSNTRRRHMSRCRSMKENARLGMIRSGRSTIRCKKIAQAALLAGAGSWIAATAFVCATGLLLSNANRLGRRCHSRANSSSDSEWGFSFGLVSCSDNLSTVPQRPFEGIMELVSPNKRAYARKHGYAYIDASSSLDRTRPPSWSKIKAVRNHLASYDWVFWNDADSLVMNPFMSLEGVLKSCLASSGRQSLPDMVITEDVTGVNAGMFFMRDSAWSRSFLDRWWNQTAFIKPFGESKSGDNDALKFLFKTMPAAEMESHVLVAPMQCQFNSYLWIPSWKNVYRTLTLTSAVWRGTYSDGDFIVHLAGIDHKKRWIKKMLMQCGGV